MAGQTTNYLFDYPTSTDYVKDGATAIQTLATDVDTTLFTALGGAYPGLRLIKKQTIGSAVSSVAVTSAFSATYDAYKIVVTGGVGSTNSDLTFSLTGGTSVYNYSLIYVAYGSPSVAGANASSAGSYAFAGYCTASKLNINMDVLDPFATKVTTFSNQMVSNSVAGTAGGFHNSATSFTGFTLAPSSGTITGGTIYVYGYGAS
jgi:hypothetical protein